MAELKKEGGKSEWIKKECKQIKKKGNEQKEIEIDKKRKKKRKKVKNEEKSQSKSKKITEK